MTDHNKRSDDNITEPQSAEELVRITYHMLRRVNTVVFGPDGKDGLCDRMTKQETTVNVLGLAVGVGIPAIGVVVGWIVFFKHG